MKWIDNAALVLICSLLVSACLGRSVQAEAGLILVQEFIYEDAPFPECHASTLAETPHGIVAAWFGGTHEKHPDVGIWLSRRVEDHWTAPVEVANGIQHANLRHPTWNPVLFQQPAGPLHLFYKCGPSPSTWWGMWTTSDDHGVTWSLPRRLPESIDGPVKNKPVLLKNGVLLAGSSTEYDGWRLHFELTSDWGKTWRRIGPINDGKEFNAIQPTILTHADGKLQVLCRSREGYIVTSWSTGNAETWSPLERTSLPNPNSGIDAVTLRDGRHLLIYNHTKQGRSPLNLAWTADGIRWMAAYTLEHEPGEYSYPAIIQSQSGTVHLTYTWKRQQVRYVTLDPGQLPTTAEIQAGNWPNEVSNRYTSGGAQ